jgi:hypothetical protein
MSKKESKPYEKDEFFKKWLVGLSERTKENYTNQIQGWLVFSARDPNAIEYLIGVFSSTNQLLPVSEANRVPDAIDAGDDIETSQTFFSEENTDIPEDFKITPSTGFSIQVPQNAKYLFVSMADSWYPDNTSSDPIMVTAEKQAAAGFPIEYLLRALRQQFILTLADNSLQPLQKSV